MRFRLVGFLLVVAVVGWCEDAPGTSLHYFTKVADGVYAGSKPKTDADFEFLRAKGVEHVLQAHFLPWGTGQEKRRAERFGMDFVALPMNASIWPPSEKHVDAVLRMMRTRQPIYVHCVLGRDRTSLLVALYRMYFEGVSKGKAYEEMKAEGFPSNVFVHGLKVYFDRHLERPAELAGVAGAFRREGQEEK
jgi:protein-tyrosine phosphatase